MTSSICESTLLTTCKARYTDGQLCALFAATSPHTSYLFLTAYYLCPALQITGFVVSSEVRAEGTYTLQVLLADTDVTSVSKLSEGTYGVSLSHSVSLDTAKMYC
jgi:hypothetical protein